jgi:transmembrane sensor
MDWEVLARYFAGESPAAEAESVRRWLEEDAARAELLSALDRTLDRLRVEVPEVDTEAALRQVRVRMAEPPVVPLREPVSALPEQRRGGWRTIGLRAAAAVVLLIAGTFIWRAVGRDGSGSEAATYATLVGQTDSVALADGTRILLGPGSQLTVSAAYGAATREVELRGEALFDVPHDATRPFTVRAGNAIIEDLGTTFAVRSDIADEVRVVVTSGSVRLRPANAAAQNGVTLQAGERGVLSAGVTTAQPAAPEDDLAWTRGHLVFDGAPLHVVAAELRRWFGIVLRVEDADLAAHARLITTFEKDDTREHVRQVIGMTLGTSVEARGDTAIIRARSGPR